MQVYKDINNKKTSQYDGRGADKFHNTTTLVYIRVSVRNGCYDIPWMCVMRSG